VPKTAETIKHDGCANAIVETFIPSEAKNFELATPLLADVERGAEAVFAMDILHAEMSIRFTAHGKPCINDAAIQMQRDIEITVAAALKFASVGKNLRTFWLMLVSVQSAILLIALM